MIKEEVFNTEIGNLLREYLLNSEVKVESNNQLLQKSQTPDLVIIRNSREPILIEHKIDNPQALIKQCQTRLDSQWVDNKPVRVVIGLTSPKKLQDVSSSQLKKSLKTNQSFRWILWCNKDQFPKYGWLEGSLKDLAGFIDRTGATAINLSETVDQIKAALRQESEKLNQSKSANKEFSKILQQSLSNQTTRMGLAIILNAIIFQKHIADNHPELDSPTKMASNDQVNQLTVAKTWQEILTINYYPIFKLARRLLISINEQTIADNMIKNLFSVANKVSGQIGSQGLVGTIFGELIKDRKLLASFYTMPEPAALIAELATNQLSLDWSNGKQIKNLRIADLAVGTGTLLVSVYKRIAERYLLSGKNPSQLHSRIIEDVMIGCDVDPSAIHITAARLSGEYPEVDYQSTKIYAMPFGLTNINGDHQEYKIGSLDLLASDTVASLFGGGHKTIMPKNQPSGKAIDKKEPVDVYNNSLDLVIMNPPFTRPTNHESDKAEIANPAFAGLGNLEDVQKNMSKKLQKHLRKISNSYSPIASHGNAGLASNFIDLGHLKLKAGGILALIIPATFLSGNSWSNARKLLSKYYKSIIFISISARGRYGRNWSSDTSLSEIMIIAKKSDKPINTKKALHVVLNKRPATINEAVAVAQTINPNQEGKIKIGEDCVGWSIKSQFINGCGHPTGIFSQDLAHFCQNLLQSKLVFPGLKSIPLPLTQLHHLGDLGPLSRDINGINADQAARGPFDIYPLREDDSYDRVSYPVLWSHNTELEKKMIVKPDSQAIIRPNRRDQAIKVWQGYQTEQRLVAGATRLHINLEFSTGSQSLGACLTPRVAIGGRTWPSFSPKSDRHRLEQIEKTVCLWLNTTIGLISRWYMSNRQQPGRSQLGISTGQSMPVILTLIN